MRHWISIILNRFDDSKSVSDLSLCVRAVCMYGSFFGIFYFVFIILFANSLSSSFVVVVIVFFHFFSYFFGYSLRVYRSKCVCVLIRHAFHIKRCYLMKYRIRCFYQNSKNHFNFGEEKNTTIKTQPLKKNAAWSKINKRVVYKWAILNCVFFLLFWLDCWVKLKHWHQHIRIDTNTHGRDVCKHTHTCISVWLGVLFLFNEWVEWRQREYHLP